MGMTRIAMSGTDIDKVRNCLKKVDGSTTHLLGIINNILDFSKLEVGKIAAESAEFSLLSNVNFVVSMLQEQANERHISLHLHTDKINHDLITSDSLRINQILLNLISNAIKFSQNGSAVDIQIQETEYADGVGTYLFEVTDQGIGISKAQAVKLFQPFEQSDGTITRMYGGTGLGLIISKGLVEMLGGTIELESKIGEGSAFRFSIACPSRMPLVKPKNSFQPEESAMSSDDSEEKSGFDFSGNRCLIVDDIEINREIILELLADTGIDMETAVNGQEALDFFQNSNEGYYDAILMDIQMPAMDGCTATRKIRALDRQDAKETAIIAITANTLPNDIHKIMEAGMNAYVGKPIDMDVLYRELREQLVKKRFFFVKKACTNESKIL
jgi:CheY-like chemotaxis protein/anti-sigma regulatory factor (Ser/Thr protein kinase)